MPSPADRGRDGAADNCGELEARFDNVQNPFAIAEKR